MLVKKHPLFMQLSQLKNQLEIGIFEVIVILQIMYQCPQSKGHLCYSGGSVTGGRYMVSIDVVFSYYYTKKRL